MHLKCGRIWFGNSAVADQALLKITTSTVMKAVSKAVF
jgi:hypothetical protein